MTDDATLRALEARATQGPWTPDGDKIRATAAHALLPDNILVAYYTGTITGSGSRPPATPPTSSSSRPPAPRFPTAC